MMKTSKLIFCLGLLLLLHLSCSRDERRQNEPIVSKPNQARVTITLEVNDESPAVSRGLELEEQETTAADTIRGVAARYSVGSFTSTRSTPAATVNESAVNDLWAIQFDENNKLVGRPVYQDGLRGKTDVTLMLTQTPAGKQHTVYFVTNTDRSDLFTENNVPTLERFRALEHTYASETEVVTGNVLMMNGRYIGTLTDKQNLSQPIVLTRCVAKITFTYRTDEFDDGSIRVISVQLKSVPKISSYLVPTTVPYPATGNPADYAPETAPHEVRGSYTWYLPENVRGTNPAIGWEGSKSKKNAPAGQGDYATLIEVRGEVTARDGATRNISYLFYIGKDITDYSVERNRHYLLNIDIRGIDENDQRVVAGNSTPWLAPTVTIAEVTGTTATVRATITSDGGSAITNKGFYVSEDKDEIGTTRAYLGAGLYEVPGMPSPFTRAGFTPEVIEQVLTGLKINTTYYIRPFATNMYGTTVGEQGTFTTVGTPTIVTVQVSEVNASTAKVQYQITNNGMGAVTGQGVVYSTQKDFDPKAATGVIKVPSSSLTELVLGAGSAGSNNPPLLENTTYYVRAYAANGAGIGYGKQLVLVTSKPLTFGRIWITDVQDQYVLVRGVLSENTPTIEEGVSWNTTDFTDPATGTRVVSNDRFGVNYSVIIKDPYPNTWFFYPYGQTPGGGFSYGPKYREALIPYSSVPIVDISTYGVTFKVGVLTPGVENSNTSRGVMYSPINNFDPQFEGSLVEIPSYGVGAYETEMYSYKISPNQYYARSYATNMDSHTYFSSQTPFVVEPKLESKSTIGQSEEISGNPGEYTLEFATNTNWSITCDNPYVSFSSKSGESTRGETKKVTMRVQRNSGNPRDIIVNISTTANGVSAPVSYKWAMKQKTTDVYIRPLSMTTQSGTYTVYVDNLQPTLPLTLMSWDEGVAYCAAWGGRLPNTEEILILFASMQRDYPPFDIIMKYWTSNTFSDTKPYTCWYNMVGESGFVPEPRNDKHRVRCIRDYLDK